jgi:hypothetical protein
MALFRDETLYIFDEIVVPEIMIMTSFRLDNLD